MKKKKNKLTNTLKIGILFFGVSLLLWNCEKENDVEQVIVKEVVQETEFSISEIGLSEIQQNAVLFEKLNKLTKKKKNYSVK